MDRGAWRVTDHGVAKLDMTECIHTHTGDHICSFNKHCQRYDHSLVKFTSNNGLGVKTEPKECPSFNRWVRTENLHIWLIIFRDRWKFCKGNPPYPPTPKSTLSYVNCMTANIIPNDVVIDELVKIMKIKINFIEHLYKPDTLLTAIIYHSGMISEEDCIPQHLQHSWESGWRVLSHSYAS